MIVVTTPTGQIGSQVVKRLLNAGEAVRVVARDPARLFPEVRDHVETVQGSLDDEAVLSQALTGAESLFWLVPPSFDPEDTTEYYLHFARSASAAIRKSGVGRVVGVSAVGRHAGMDAGVVSASHANDAEIESTGVDFRALWCPSFMENTLDQLGPLKAQGMFFLPEPPDRKAPKVATRDIAASGARLLLDRSWTGQGGLGVFGPEDLSNDNMAAIMTAVLGTPIRFQQVSGEAYKARLLELGASASFARELTVMHEAKGNGLDNSEPRTPENTTPTSFRQWCEEVLKPVWSAAV